MSVENKLISENLEEISQAKVMARLAGRSYLTLMIRKTKEKTRIW